MPTLSVLKSTSSQEQLPRDGLRIGEIAERAGVNTSLIRYYERIGLLPAPERVSGQRRYDASVLRRLAVIDVAQRAGLSLDEIRDLLEIGQDPLSDRLQELALHKLPEIEALIDRAQRVRTWLTAATTCDCQSVDECALFDDAALPAGNGPGLTVVQVPAGVHA
jgi:MerR family redox-sensitive transcriptional activator SoxR